MDEQIMYYWDNRLAKDEVDEPNVNDYILHFVFINQHNNTGINKWFSCDSKNKLIGFIKYVIIPSIQVSRAVADNKGNEGICLDSIGYVEAVELLEEINVDIKYIEEYEKWFEKFRSYKEDPEFEEIKSSLEYISNSVDVRSGFVVTLELYENIKEVGLELIRIYEEEDMIDVLEDCFNFRKEEIENIFNDLDKNKFLLKRIMPILDNLNMI